MNLSDIRIVVDSSADGLQMADLCVRSAPLKIVTDVAQWVDDDTLDVAQMAATLATYKGRSGTSCPSMGDFLEAFGDAPYVFCITMTSNLSGTYNVALSAAREYEELGKGRVHVFDSRNTGGGMRLIAEKIRELLLAGKDFDGIVREVEHYKGDIELLFLLESLNNLANNGRVSRTVAKIAGLLGIRLLGRAVDGQVSPVAKPRGDKKALLTTFAQMEELGYQGGKVRISHCENETGALAAKNLVMEKYPDADVQINKMGGLCSFYAERAGLIIGFEIGNEWA